MAVFVKDALSVLPEFQLVDSFRLRQCTLAPSCRQGTPADQEKWIVGEFSCSLCCNGAPVWSLGWWFLLPPRLPYEHLEKATQTSGEMFE